MQASPAMARLPAIMTANEDAWRRRASHHQSWQDQPVAILTAVQVTPVQVARLAQIHSAQIDQLRQRIEPLRTQPGIDPQTSAGTNTSARPPGAASSDTAM